MLKPVERRSISPATTERCRDDLAYDDLAELAKTARQGDPLAVRTFVVAVGPALLRVVRRMLGRDHPDVEDLFQEVTLQVVDALPRYESQCSVLHFACRVAVLTAMNARRRERAHKRTLLRPGARPVETLAASEPGLEATLATQHATTAVRDLLTILPQPQAEALGLHCLLGYTIDEIAGSTGVSTETVRSRLRLAKQALRRRMLNDPALKEVIEGAS